MPTSTLTLEQQTANINYFIGWLNNAMVIQFTWRGKPSASDVTGIYNVFATCKISLRGLVDRFLANGERQNLITLLWGLDYLYLMGIRTHEKMFRYLTLDPEGDKLYINGKLKALLVSFSVEEAVSYFSKFATAKYETSMVNMSIFALSSSVLNDRRMTNIVNQIYTACENKGIFPEASFYNKLVIINGTTITPSEFLGRFREGNFFNMENVRGLVEGLDHNFLQGLTKNQWALLSLDFVKKISPNAIQSMSRDFIREIFPVATLKINTDMRKKWVYIVGVFIGESHTSVVYDFLYNKGYNFPNLLLGTVGNDSVNDSRGDDVLIMGGMGDDTLTSNSLNDVLIGGAGNDFLISNSFGSSTLIGGSGRDIYYVNQATDFIIEEDASSSMDSWDEVFSIVASFSLSANVEGLNYTRSNNFIGIGNDSNNKIFGNVGNDILIGGNGDDVLDGGDGIDTLYGGAGDDIYYVDAVADIVIEDTNDSWLDVVYSRATSFSLSVNVEILDYTESSNFIGVGNDLNNIIVGDVGADMLYGGAGDDTLQGGDGDDTLMGGAGNDSLRGGVGSDKLYGVDRDDTLIGGDGHDVLDGGDGYDVLVGGDGYDVLVGGDGEDTLAGGYGSDVLNGGNGNDILSGFSGSDTYQFARNDGVDMIFEYEISGAGDMDVLLMTEVDYNQLWFKQVNDGLEVSVIGTNSKVVIANWYLGEEYRIEQFKTENGNRVLSSGNVANLVNAMAAFAVPNTISLSDTYKAVLDEVLRTNWGF